jgi:hypothetical protein
VTVFQVNDELSFLVLSDPGEEAAPEGARFVLETPERAPLATIELIERDRVGFAIASILERPSASPAIRKGLACFARRLPSS